MYFKSQLDSNLEDGLGVFESETALIEVSAPSEGSAYIIDISRAAPLAEIQVLEPPSLMMQSNSPLGEFWERQKPMF